MRFLAFGIADQIIGMGSKSLYHIPDSNCIYQTTDFNLQKPFLIHYVRKLLSLYYLH